MIGAVLIAGCGSGQPSLRWPHNLSTGDRKVVTVMQRSEHVTHSKAVAEYEGVMRKLGRTANELMRKDGHLLEQVLVQIPVGTKR